MTRTAVLHYQGSREAFLERLSDEPRLGSLFVTAAGAAFRTAVNAKARALGLLLAEAMHAGNEQGVDESELLIHALAGQQAPGWYRYKVGDIEVTVPVVVHGSHQPAPRRRSPTPILRCALGSGPRPRSTTIPRPPQSAPGFLDRELSLRT
jgi:hypothetical protein